MKKVIPFIGALLLSAATMRATPVNVSEVGVGAAETVWITSSSLGSNLHVYAGVLKLQVDGVNTTGFCIDPWHWSANGGLPYETEDLSLAPKSATNSSPNPMGASAALQIEQLWAQYYNPAISNITAAALQIKIWQIVDLAVTNGTFSLISIDGADSASVYNAITGMDTFLGSNPNAPAADLVALTGPGQDYVVQRVPDGGTTVFLLGLAFLALALVRKWGRA